MTVHNSRAPTTLLLPYYTGHSSRATTTVLLHYTTIHQNQCHLYFFALYFFAALHHSPPKSVPPLLFCCITSQSTKISAAKQATAQGAKGKPGRAEALNTETGQPLNFLLCFAPAAQACSLSIVIAPAMQTCPFNLWSFACCACFVAK